MTRSRPPKAGRQSRRDEIVQSALELYANRGVAAVTPADLGRATGMTSTAIRYHFPTTDDLLAAITDPFLNAVDSVIKAHPSDPLWPDGVRQLLTDFITTILENRAVALLILSDPTLASHEVIGGRFDAATRHIRSAIAGPNPTPNREAAAIAAVGGIWRPIRILDSEEVQRSLDNILDVVLSGHHREPQ